MKPPSTPERPTAIIRRCMQRSSNRAYLRQDFVSRRDTNGKILLPQAAILVVPNRSKLLIEQGWGGKALGAPTGGRRPPKPLQVPPWLCHWRTQVACQFPKSFLAKPSFRCAGASPPMALRPFATHSHAIRCTASRGRPTTASIALPAHPQAHRTVESATVPRIPARGSHGADLAVDAGGG